MRAKGVISRWDDEKGYGFIKPPNGGKELFIHIKAFQGFGRRPVDGDEVSFVFGKDERGRECALEAEFVNASYLGSPTRLPLIGSLAWLVIVMMLCLIKPVLLVVPFCILFLSLITYFMYREDKFAAQRGARRVPEGNLLFFGSIGGWPGGWIAQVQFRHKTRKQPFRSVFWVTVAVNSVTTFSFLVWASASKDFNDLIGMGVR